MLSVEAAKAKLSNSKIPDGLGVHANSAWNTAKSGKGWWRLSATPALQQAMSNAWFEGLGLVNLERIARTVTI